MKTLQLLYQIDFKLYKILLSYLKTIKMGFRVSVFYLLPIGLLLLSLTGLTSSFFYKELGSIALGLLSLILFITPVVKITKLKTLQLIRTFRREFGLASFYLFLFHTAGLIYLQKLFTLQYYTQPGHYLFWGSIAAAGMLLLGITSNNLSVKLLRRHWKTLQRIAIPTYFFALAHSYKIDEGTILPAIIIFTFYLLLRIIENKLDLQKILQQINQEA